MFVGPDPTGMQEGGRSPLVPRRRARVRGGAADGVQIVVMASVFIDIASGDVVCCRRGDPAAMVAAVVDS
jgi:hypothetical protein